MDLIFEFILDLLVESGIDISSNRKISKWIRYPILVILILFFSIVIFGIIILGIVLLKRNILFGSILIIIGLVLLIGSIIKFRNVYCKQNSRK